MARPAWRFLVQLRPVWWVLRAWIVYRVIMILWGSGESYYFLPRDVLAWALLIVLTVLSVRLSLKTLPSEHWPARIRTILNVVTALIAVAVVPTAISVINRPPGHEIYGPETGGPCALYDGVCHNGSVVGPFFVYGPDGTRLENVRFFTNDGSSIPIDLAPAEDPGPWVVAPRSTSGGSTSGTSPAPSPTAPGPTTPGSAVPGTGATSAPRSPAPPSAVTQAPTSPTPKPSATPGR